MALLPTREKEWQLVGNINSGTDRRQILIDRLAALCGVAFGSFQITANAWHVVKCSNSSTVSTSNIWSATSDIVQGNAAGSNARSWVLLQNAFGKQWLWDYRGNTADEIYLSMSPSGLFTGGTTTAAPTATDQLFRDPTSGSVFFYDILQTGKTVYQNVLHSADGKQTVIWTLLNSSSSSLWLFGTPEDVPADWSHPGLMWMDLTTNDTISVTFMNKLTGASGGFHITGEGAAAGSFASLHFVREGIDTAPIGGGTGGEIDIKNELSNEWDIWDKCWLASLLEGGWGQLGYWPDLYPLPRAQTGALTGSHFPASGSRQWVKVNDLLLPWGAGVDMTVPA
jgi:hypothetical protein